MIETDILDTYKPEYNLLTDAYLGSKDLLQEKLDYLARIAQPEKWDCGSDHEKKILLNYLCYTYDRVKMEQKISYTADGKCMCFNTGLLTEYGGDIYAFFVENKNPAAKGSQKWFLNSFKQATDTEIRQFHKMPELADYFTEPSDFIYDKNLPLNVDYDHIINNNYDRFTAIGLDQKFMIEGLLRNAVKVIVEKVKRNYKLALPQYYTDKQTGEAKIQLLLPLFLTNKEKADLALVVDKGDYGYVGKTVLPLDYAYVNYRRIVKPESDWLMI